LYPSIDKSEHLSYITCVSTHTLRELRKVW
jgi:hypothetical protein